MVEATTIGIWVSQIICFFVGLIWGRMLGFKSGWTERIEYQEEIDEVNHDALHAVSALGVKE